MTYPYPSRRGLLSLGAGLGMTFLAAPVLADPRSAPRKLVVIVCRGAMDGLSVSPPVGDPDYAALRGPIAIPPDKVLKLDADFGLHPKLATIYALAQSGQARIAPAVAIPERIRSHFEAQDLLESGGARVYDVTTGWLNRALAAASPRRPGHRHLGGTGGAADPARPLAGAVLVAGRPAVGRSRPHHHHAAGPLQTRPDPGSGPGFGAADRGRRRQL